jgi:tetratricopeptide (TPR) repeat protein
MIWLSLVFLAGCALPGAAPGPPPTLTPPLAPYTAAIATAAAGSDTKAQAAAYYARGNVQLDAGANEAAIADYDQAIARDPSDARAFNNRALAYVALGSLLLAPYDMRSLIVFMLAAAGLTAANRHYYRFFYAKRGAWFVARVWAMHLVHNLCNGLSFAVGTVLFFAATLGVRLPGSLPTVPWSASVTAPDRGPARQQA